MELKNLEIDEQIIMTFLGPIESSRLELFLESLDSLQVTYKVNCVIKGNRITDISITK